jgi:hypothetical protein
MIIDPHKAAHLLGRFYMAYGHPVADIIDVLLSGSKRGVGAIASSEGAPSYTKHFVKNKQHTRLLKLFVSSMEKMALRSKQGRDELGVRYTVRVGPGETGGYIAKIEIDTDTKGQTFMPMVNLTVPNEEAKPWQISIPLVTIMKRFKLDIDKHSGYAHGLGYQEGVYPLTYAGITKRHWLTRYAEHFRDANRGSKKRFHQHWIRAFRDVSALSFSELCAVNMSYDEVMEWEEAMVDRLMSEGRALNMIPGGKKGIAFLHEHRLLNNDRPSLSELDEALHRFSQSNKGTPNPLISALWQDADYAAKVICGGKNRLSVQQLARIRHMALHGVCPDAIAKQVDARSLAQVTNVINGKTYSKVNTPLVATPSAFSAS